MLQCVFDYPVGARMLKVVASCKGLTEEGLIGLSVVFLDKDEEPVKVEYDADMFQDIEDEASIMLADLYYNPEVSFNQHQH
jgi:hypothetical protein